MFAGTNGGPLHHRFFLSRTPELDVNDPFYDKKDSGMTMAIRSKRLRDDHPEHRARVGELFVRHLPTAPGAIPACLLTQTFRENILVTEAPSTSADSGN